MADILGVNCGWGKKFWKKWWGGVDTWGWGRYDTSVELMIGSQEEKGETMGDEGVSLVVHYCCQVSREGYPVPPICSIGWSLNLAAMKLRVLTECEGMSPNVIHTLVVMDSGEGLYILSWNGDEWVRGEIELVSEYPPLFPVINLCALCWAAGTFGKVGEASLPLFDKKGEPVNSVKEIATALHSILYGV